MTQPQHTFGLSPRTVKEYAHQLLEALYQQYSNGDVMGLSNLPVRSSIQFRSTQFDPCPKEKAGLKAICTFTSLNSEIET